MEVPLEKLAAIRERIGLGELELQELNPFRQVFAEKAGEFADYFHRFFSSMPETRIFLEYEERPGHLRTAWADWFRSLFEQEQGDALLSYLWRVGIRHVEVNLDQRYTNLGFSLVRQFCQRVISEKIPLEKRLDVAVIIDKILDLCLLVETSAYIASTTRCDIEVIRGIADRIRNRITVIGGNLIRLQKKLAETDPEFETYGRLISESTTCENLVKDIRTYNEIFRKEHVAVRVSLKEVVGKALASLDTPDDVRIELDIGDNAVMADRDDMEQMFVQVIQNSLEAVDRGNPVIRISAHPSAYPPAMVGIEIFNTGTAPREEDMERIFSPFYSTKATGTGFGLSIARLAARKNYGKLLLQSVHNEGTMVSIILPRGR
ncbi:MAG: ATP-binding protein [Thermodesulfovibrionales bacterium]|jgi:signal transduction histidine kinase